MTLIKVGNQLQRHKGGEDGSTWNSVIGRIVIALILRDFNILIVLLGILIGSVGVIIGRFNRVLWIRVFTVVIDLLENRVFRASI